MSTICGRFEEQVVELAEGLLPPAAAHDLQDHAAACGACTRLLRREAGLVALLRSLPAAPAMDLAAPALPAGRVLRMSPLRLGVGVAAVAAGLLLAVAVATGWTDRGAVSHEAPAAAQDTAPPSGQRVRVRSVVDGIERVPLPDEGLLALTAGIEAVAMRRPTESR